MFTNLSLSLVMLSPPLVICLLASLGAYWLSRLLFVLLPTSRASVADFHYSFTRHAVTASHADAYPETHRGSYEHG